jgi:hypothetical protein
MPILTEPVGVLLVAAAVLVALVVWLCRDRRHRGPRLVTDDDGIDREKLEAAEQAVRSAVQKAVSSKE